jgi:hypothetical protein
MTCAKGYGQRARLGYNKVYIDRYKPFLSVFRLKRNLGSMADLVRVYRARQPVLAQLDQRIAATDRLIDQIVYALYGLTEDEIALVEGR